MIQLSFTGDIAFSKYFTGLADKEDLLSPAILSFLAESDHVIANVEGPISLGEKKGADAAAPVHASDARCADWLQRIGADIWNIANNHVLDCQITGYDDTLAQAKRVGARTFGAGRSVDEARAPLILDEEGGIGIFSVCYRKAYRATDEKEGTLFWYDDEIIEKTIREIKAKCRWCFIVAHCGEEFAPLAPTYVRERYHTFLKMGADAVIGHHPHVPQQYERVGKKLIFYSLGNFIFDTDYQRIQAHTDLGVLVKLRIDGEHFDFTHLPYRIDRKTHTLSEIDELFVFRHISPAEYGQIAPLVAHVFWQNYRRARLFLRPYEKSMTKPQFLVRYREERQPSAVRSILRDDRRYTAAAWRRANPDLISYILEKPKK